MSDSIIKIGFDAKRLFHNYTGLGNYSRTLVKNLKQIFPQYEIHLFTPSIVENDETSFFLSGIFNIHTPKATMPDFLWRRMYVSHEIDKLKLDIYHGLSNELPILKSNTKLVVTIHDLICEIFPSHFAFYDSWIYQRKSRQACKTAAKVIAISESTKNDIIKEYKLDPSKIEVIYQSINPVYTVESNRISRRKYFLYVGSINERKRLVNIIEAMNLLEEDYLRPLLIVGNGNRYKQEAIALAKKYKISHYLDFRDNIPNEKIVQYYDDAICLILPSVYEGFGIPVAESLYRRIPVITSNTSSLPEAAGPGGILTTPDDIPDLKNAMMQMFDKEKWENYSLNGYEYVKNKFNAENQAINLDCIYRSLVKK